MVLIGNMLIRKDNIATIIQNGKSLEVAYDSTEKGKFAYAVVFESEVKAAEALTQIYTENYRG